MGHPKTAPLPVESGEYKLIVPWPRVNISNNSSTGSVAFVGLTFVTNRHTDRHTDRHTHTDHTGRQTHRLHLRPKNSNQRRKKIMTSKCPTKRGKSKGSPYSLTRFLAVSLQVMWVINPAVGCHYFPPGPQLLPQPLRGLLPILLIGEQTHDECEQLA